MIAVRDFQRLKTWSQEETVEWQWKFVTSKETGPHIMDKTQTNLKPNRHIILPPKEAEDYLFWGSAKLVQMTCLLI